MTGKGKAGSGGKVLVSDRDIANTSPCILLTASVYTSTCIIAERITARQLIWVHISANACVHAYVCMYVLLSRFISRAPFPFE